MTAETTTNRTRENFTVSRNRVQNSRRRNETASWILNSEDMPDWEDLQTACRQICDAREDLKLIREKVAAV